MINSTKITMEALMLSCSQIAGALSFLHNSESQNKEEGKPLYVHVF